MWKDSHQACTQLLDWSSRYGVVVNVQRDHVKIFKPNIFSDWKSSKTTSVEVSDSLSYPDGGLFPASACWFSNEPFANGE